MCIKVNEDEALRSRNRARTDAAQSGTDVEWAAIVERARAAAGASAAILSMGADQCLVVCGAIAGSAQGLAQTVAATAWPGNAQDAGVGLRTSEGEKPCPEVLALQRRFGFRSLTLMYWHDGLEPQPAWLALVNAPRDAMQPAAAARLRYIAESLRGRCILQARLREATLLVQRLEDVARASGDWCWETDVQNRYTWVDGVSPPASQQAIIPPTIGELIPSGLVVDWRGEPESPLRDFHAVLRQGEPIVRLVTREYVGGKARYVSRSAVPLLRCDGTLRGFRGSARDVTESLEAKMKLWRREEILRAAKEKAEASSQAKSMLVSKVGHELRTPLNAIVGLAQLIQTRNAPGDNATVERWVTLIAKTGWHMVDVLNMLMEFGRAGTVAASVTSRPVDLVEVAREAAHLVERDAQARCISIAFDGHASVEAVVDRTAIYQTVVNLLSNAIKYNQEGGWVRLSVTQGEDARIEIQDSGPGLTAEQIARLGRPFDRLGADASKVTGSGLGLLICQELVAWMRGRIDVQSKVGHGTTFTVRLPLSHCCVAVIEGETA